MYAVDVTMMCFDLHELFTGQQQRQRRGVRKDKEFLPQALLDGGFAADHRAGSVATGMGPKSAQRAALVVASELADRSALLSAQLPSPSALTMNAK